MKTLIGTINLLRGVLKLAQAKRRLRRSNSVWARMVSS